MKYQECVSEIANLYLAGDSHSVKILDKVLRSTWKSCQGEEPLATKGWFLDVSNSPVLYCQIPDMKWELAKIIDKVKILRAHGTSGYPERVMQYRMDRLKRKSKTFLRY